MVCDTRKGGDLLRKAIGNVTEKTRGKDLRLLIYGQEASSTPESACLALCTGLAR